MGPMGRFDLWDYLGLMGTHGPTWTDLDVSYPYLTYLSHLTDPNPTSGTHSGTTGTPGPTGPTGPTGRLLNPLDPLDPLGRTGPTVQPEITGPSGVYRPNWSHRPKWSHGPTPGVILPKWNHRPKWSYRPNWLYWSNARGYHAHALQGVADCARRARGRFSRSDVLRTGQRRRRAS